MGRRIQFAFAALCLAFISNGKAASAQDATGAWTTEGAKSIVQIAPCGAGLCGKIVSLKEPTDAAGQPKKDTKNKEASKRGRSLIGLSVLSGMQKDSENRWAGNIYNPEDGKTYKAYMTLSGAKQLLVEGCLLGGLVCKKQRWTR